MANADTVKVAVRVRPFNTREKERNAVCCIDMQNDTTKIVNPDQPGSEGKTFTFDFSYWSHDGFVDNDGILEGTSPKYATQQKVFDDLGRGVLDNAFNGYNCSLFAYGQTGAGKSYSMVGYGKNLGIVPITCDELFKAIESSSGDVKYEVTFSMLEIYNEQVRDLLSKSNPKGGLTVRQNPKLGLFYVENLKNVAVGSYDEISRRMDEGTANRTVASTQMNATSSRAHTVVTITFDQISKNESGAETKKSSSINLVDLAGSERADSTGATGDRLKEGANINKSLSALGNVISALADLSMGKKKVMVPYRDSVLTRLLRNALGGNSKTIMIAALSPASINYDETLGTLRYADRAKKIKNQAVVNENPMEKLIRELREENERLKKSLSGDLPPETGGGQMTPEELEKLKESIKEQLLANQHEMGGLDWDQKLKEAREEDAATVSTKTRHSNVPHLMNLNEDPMLSGVIFHVIEDGQTTMVGRKDADPTPQIVLTGLSIQKQHAEIEASNNEVTIKPGSQGAKIKVNGTPLTGPRTLVHKDRVLFGSNHLYVYMNPVKPEAPEGTPDSIDWEFAQQEIAESSGFATMQAGMTKEQQRIQEQVLELLPMISEVNAVSEELNKYRMFELVLLSGAAQDGKDKSAKVMVKVKNLLNKNEWLWERGQFINRRYMIQELYQQYVDGDESYKTIEQDKDPFYDPPQDILIGQSTAFLQSLSYGLDFDDRLAITDYKGQEEGCLYVTIAPCDAKGKPWGDDNFVEEPEELVGRDFFVKITIKSADIENSRFTKGCYISYKFYNEEEDTQTKALSGTLSPQFNENKVFRINKITPEHLEYFETGSISFSVYGKQVDTAPSESLKKLTTKELRDMDGQIREQRAPLLRRNTNIGLTGSVVVADSQLKSELQTMQKKFDLLQKKEKRMQEICTEWSNKKAEEQDFSALLRAIHAVAFSSGNKLKNRVKLVNALMKTQSGKQLVNGGKNGNATTVTANGKAGKEKPESSVCSVM